MDRFESDLSRLDRVGNVIGPATQLKTANFLFLSGRWGTRALPSSPAAISDVIDSFDTARGVLKRREVIADDMRHAAVSVIVRGADYRATRDLMVQAQALAQSLLGHSGAGVVFGGDLASSQRMITAIVNSTAYSLIFAVAGVFLTVLFLSGSLRIAVTAIIIPSIAVVCLLGVFGYLDIPIGIASSTIFSMIVGVGADYPIYWLYCFRGLDGSARGKAGAGDPRVPIAKVTQNAAPGILTSCAAAAGGFGLLVIAHSSADHLIGIILPIMLFVCATLTLVCLPASLELLRRRQRARSPLRGG
jgi:predicted exporter